MGHWLICIQVRDGNGLSSALDRTKYVAGNAVAICGKIQRRLGFIANILPVRTTRMKSAAWRRIHGTRHIALKNDMLFLPACVGHGHSGEQGSRIGMLGVLVDGLALGDLDDFARYMMATRWLMCSTTLKSCEIKKYVYFPAVPQEVDNSPDRTPSDDTGSSATMNFAPIQSPRDADAFAVRRKLMRITAV
jgi:hypothetical protein